MQKRCWQLTVLGIPRLCSTWRESREESRSGHSVVSFDFGFSGGLESDADRKLCGLHIHDKFTGAMHCVPTDAKGGRRLNYLCTLNLCLQVVSNGAAETTSCLLRAPTQNSHQDANG